MCRPRQHAHWTGTKSRHSDLAAISTTMFMRTDISTQAQLDGDDHVTICQFNKAITVWHNHKCQIKCGACQSTYAKKRRHAGCLLHKMDCWMGKNNVYTKRENSVTSTHNRREITRWLRATRIKKTHDCTTGSGYCNCRMWGSEATSSLAPWDHLGSARVPFSF